MDPLDDDFLGPHALDFAKNLHNNSLPQLDMSALQFNSTNAFSETYHSPSGPSEFSMSPVTPRTPFLHRMDGSVLEGGLSTSNRTTGYNTPEVHQGEQTVPHHQYMHALRQISALKCRAKALENANIDLLATVRAMKGLYASMGQPGGASLNGAPAGSPSTHVTINGLLVPNTDYPSPTYDSAEHGHFKFWTAEDWTPYSTGGSKSEQAMSDDGVPIYIEDEDGNVFTNGAYSELRLLIKRLFRDLVGHSLDPETWGSSGTHATRYVYSEVYKAFPVLAKCQAHFRLHVLLTRMYPDFTRLDVTKAAREAVKQENVDAAIPEGSTSSKKRQTASTSQARSSKRTKHTHTAPTPEAVPGPTPVPASAHVAFGSFAVSYDPNPAQAPPASTTKSSKPRPFNTISAPAPTDSMPSPSPNPDPAPTPNSTASDSPPHNTPVPAPTPTPNSAPMPNRPSTSHVAPTPAPNPNPAPMHNRPPSISHFAPTPDPAPASMATSTPTSTHKPTPTSAPAPARAPPNVPGPMAPLQFMVGNPLNILRDAAAPPLPNLVTPAMDALVVAARTAPPESSKAASLGQGGPGTVKKAGRMRVSKTSRTARNLYAHVYLRDNPTATTDGFDCAFKALDAVTKEEYAELHQFAQGRPEDEALECIIDAFFALTEEARKILRVSEKKGRPAKAKGKASKGKGRAPA